MGKKLKKDNAKEWTAYDFDKYRRLAESLVHFSAKGINSNAEPGGVRLGPDDGLELPYVSARCLLAHGVTFEVDYQEGAPNSKVLSQLKQIANGSHKEQPDIAEKARAAYVEALGKSVEFSPDKVCCRLRQILLPKGNGEYRAITPLPAGGLSRIINARVRIHNEQVTEAYKRSSDNKASFASIPRSLRMATVGVGGANPVNVGSLAIEMQTPLIFTAPTENPALRDAYRIHYQGIPIRLPYQPMLAWRRWRDQSAAANDGSLPTGLEAREAERGLLLEVANTVLRSGAEALRLLQTHQDSLPGGECLSAGLDDATIRGLIDPAKRDSGWARAFAQRVAAEMGGYAPNHQQGKLVMLNSEAMATIAGWIEEIAR